jgi:predicted dehydrogenase
VVGARRSRHGVGDWLARHLAAAGAELAAVVGSRLATATLAAEELAPALGHPPLALASPDDLSRLPDLSGLVIASPHETHEPWLRFAVDRRLHVLCEKPLVWGSADAVTWAGALARRFAQRGLHLLVNAQWPHALPSFCTLHPHVALDRARSLAVRLAPPARGLDMLPDALPHALSLLYAVAPDPRARLTDVVAAWGDDEGRSLALRFAYLAGARRLDVRVDLAEGGESPRPFALALDGASARREVDPATYAMRWVDGERSVPLPDPMAALAARFVALVRDGGPPEPDPSATLGVEHLAQVHAATPALAVTEIRYP